MRDVVNERLEPFKWFVNSKRIRTAKAVKAEAACEAQRPSRSSEVPLEEATRPESRGLSVYLSSSFLSEPSDES